MADYSLGRAHGEIDVDASSLGRASASLKFMADRMLLLGGAAIAGFGYAVKAAADFETQMSRFKAVSDTSEKDLERVRQKALQLGRDSAFGAKQVAEGFVEIAKSGATATEVLAGLGDAAVYLAAAGEIDMALATEILINAMRQFNIEAKDAGHIADLLAGAANASTSEVDDLANSLKYAGPVAAMAGISIEDTATVLAMFANAGIKGSQAGTTLRGVILGLAANTPKAEKTLRSLGIVTLDGANAFFDLEGKLKPLPEVFQILNNALSELNPAADQRPQRHLPAPSTHGCLSGCSRWSSWLLGHAGGGREDHCPGGHEGEARQPQRVVEDSQVLFGDLRHHCR